MDERAAVRAHRLAGEGRARGRSAGVDAGHQRASVRGAAVQITLPRAPTQEELAGSPRHAEGRWSRARSCSSDRSAAVPVTFNPGPAAPRGRRRRHAADGSTARRAGGGRAGAAARRRDSSRARPLTANQVDEQLNAVPGRQRRARAHQRRRPRSRPDSRVRQPHLRSRPRRRPPSSCATRTTAGSRACWPTGAPSSSSSTSSTARYPEGRTSYNVDRRDSGHRQGGRSRDARRPSRLVARRHRRHRQRHRLRGDDGSGADPRGDRREAAADDSRRAVERRRAGPARLAGLRQRALRHVREPEAGVRQARRLLQHGLAAPAARAA